MWNEGRIDVEDFPPQYPQLPPYCWCYQDSYINMYKQNIDEFTQRNENIKTIKVNLEERFKLQIQRAEDERKQFSVIEEDFIKADEKITLLINKKQNFDKENSSLRESISEYKTRVFELENKRAQAQNVFIETQTNVSSSLRPTSFSFS